LSDLSVKEQIKLFSECKILVCSHGAAMVNTIFSKPMKIIELYPKNRAFGYNYHFYQTSHYANHQHIMLLCGCDEKENVIADLEDLKSLFI
jgi:capsular polysaccharide biosynthesis protein